MNGRSMKVAQINFEKARTMFLENKGKLLPNSPIRYETAAEMKSRFLECMSKYRRTSDCGSCCSSNAHAPVCAK